MKCNYCEFSFSNIHEGEKQTRKKPFKCVICDTRFESKMNLETHIDGVHEEKKPFMCEYCKAGFSENVNMKTGKNYP